MKKSLRILASILATCAIVQGVAQAAIPLQVNYQGRVAVSGAPFNGNGLFRFTLADADTSVTIWCNDGSQVGLPASNVPTSAVSLPVIGGIFNVRLGDTIHPNMTALPSSVFDTDRVVLRTWFDDGTHGLALLSPDQPITSVAYAFHAAKADIVTPWEEVTTDTEAAPNHGYLVNNASSVTISLPTSASLAVGDTIRVSGAGPGGWKIAQQSGQKIRVGTFRLLGTWAARESNRDWISVASSADGTKLVACVLGGQIYTSSDSGTSWTARDSIRNWYAVASSVDGTKLVACVYSAGQIYTSSDSGTSWTARESNRDWRCVASSADGTKLLACAWGDQIYTSSNSGVSWMARESNRSWRGVASSSDGTKLVACVQGGQIYTSSNSGVNWTARESNRDWRSVASSADGTKLVACVDVSGQIYTSSDSGVTWTARESVRNWYNVATSADGRKLVACVIDGPIYTSWDSGATWTARESSRTWRGVASSSDGTKLVACEEGGQIYTCFDAPETSPGPSGWLGGGKDDAVELQYIGANTFMVLSHEGSLSAQ